MRKILAALAVGGILLMAGCGGLNQQPLAPDRATPSQALTPSKASPRLALSGIQTRTDKGWFYPDREGSLSVSFSPYGDNQTVRVEQATFRVAKGAITEPVNITMQATTGLTVNDVTFNFRPDGLTFNPNATLTVILCGPVNSQKLKAYHIKLSLSGTVVEAAAFTLTSLGGNRWEVVIQVPGFSTYSLGDDLIPEGELP
jgi:hypothetical protein